MRSFRWIWLAVVLFAMPAYALPVALSVAEIVHPLFSAQRIDVRLDGLPGSAGHRGSAAELAVGRLSVAGRTFAQVHLRCGQFIWETGRIACRQGEFRQKGASVLPIGFEYFPARQYLELDLGEGDLATLAAVFPELAAWHPVGRVTVRFQGDTRRAQVVASVRQAAFSDAEGKRAGDKIDANVDLSLLRQADGWRWQGKIDWPRGEAYFDPVYRAAGLRIAGYGQMAAQAWTIDAAELSVAGIGSARGSLQWLPAAGRLHSARFDSGSLDIAALVAHLVQPFMDRQAGPKLLAGGKATMSLALDERGIERIEILVGAGSVSGGGFALQGVEARVPWRRDAATQATVHVAGGSFGSLPLGAFDVPLALNGFDVALPRLEIPVLDGLVLLEDFRATRREIGGIDKGGGGAAAFLPQSQSHSQKQTQWQWKLSGAVYPLSMPLLAKTLGWPAMEGTVSASIPRVRYEDQTLWLDGALMVAAFDGYLAASDLRVLDPFGTLPRVQADVEVRHFDLGMLTRTFSFGDITGYVDADVKDLELAGRRPLAFDARIRSGDGDYPRRISQRAVQNISSLGGAGAGAAIQRSFLRFFETFGYERIGLNCRLVNDVCLMGGIPGERADSGYMLVQGGGIPALNVIGYNRRVNWDELVSRLQDVIAGNGKIEIR